MRTIFASNFAGDANAFSPIIAESLSKHLCGARSGTPANSNGFTGSPGSLAAGLRGTGQCLVSPSSVSLNYPYVSPLDTAPPTSDHFFAFKLTTSALSQDVTFVDGIGTILALRTNGSGKLIVVVNSITYTATTLTIAIGTVYACEVLIRAGTSLNGAFQVRIDGMLVAGLSASGITTGSDPAVRSVSWNNANLSIGELIWRVGTDAFSTSLFIGGGDELIAPHVSDHFVVGDGVYTNLDMQKTAPNQPDTTFANDWEQLKGPIYDGFGHFLFKHAIMPRQSWIYAAFTDGENPVIVSAHQHIVCAGNINATIPVQFLVINRAEYIDPTLQNLTTLYTSGGNFNQWGLSYDSNSQFGGSAISYDLNPDTGVAWTVADLAALEGGLYNQRYVDPTLSADDITITQAVLSVVWYEGAAISTQPPEELGAECAPCDEPKSAHYLDSFLEYSGENETAGTVTLQLAPGANWTTVGLTHTLVSAALFLATDDDAPKKAFRLGDPHGDFVIVDVVTFTSTSSMTVTNRTAVPLSLQSVATAEWARMVSEVSGIDHLEGETVYALLDGIPDGPFTVVSGDVDFGTGNHAAVAVVGLQITAEIQTLDFDVPGQGRSVSALQKITPHVFIQCEKSRTFTMATSPDDGVPADGRFGTYSFLEKSEQADQPDLIVSRKKIFAVPADWGNRGSIFIRHTDPLPLKILAIEPRVDAVGKKVI